MMSNQIELQCLLEGDHSTFRVKIVNNRFIETLKELVHAKCITERHILAKNLQLLKVNIPLRGHTRHTLKRLGFAEGDEGVQDLIDWERVSASWPTPPADDNLHIFVKLPAVMITESSSNKSNATIDPSIIKRDAYVKALYERLSSLALVQVRGTPASGKSTLANLLHAYILQVNPLANVVFVPQWNAHKLDWKKQLRSYGWNPRTPSFIIIDEAQATYTNAAFWHTMKNTNPLSNDRIILFCCYGSPTDNTDIVGRTPIVINKPQRISLQPVADPDYAPVGLLLKEEEYEDFINNRSLRSKFDDSLLKTIFDFTAGHVGAIIDFVNVIRACDIYHRLRTTNDRLTLKQFWDDTPYDQFIGKIRKTSTIFRCGLPEEGDLHKPSIARVFQSVLECHSVNGKSFNKEEKDALDKCYERGWLHSDFIDNHTLYFFPSPLHQSYVERLLYGSRHVSVQEETLLAYVIAVCRRISPSSILKKRPIGAACIRRPPEAQYCDEFYRASSAHTEGSVITFSEFSVKEGRVDFFVPSKKWGIEILRDGDQLRAHHDRFVTGAYAKWMDDGVMEDYIILDFRSTDPRIGHEDMTHLYHVILDSEGKGFMKIVDNMLKRVCDDIRLLPE